MQIQLSPEQNKSSNAANANRIKPQPFFPPIRVQPKLTIGAADDPYERDADAMADRVMRMSDQQNSTSYFPETKSPFFSSKSMTAFKVQRECASCEKEKLKRMEKRPEEEEKIQKKSQGGLTVGMEAPSIVQDVINSSGGKSLDSETRSFMEPRFNSDFSNVKIHDNNLAAKSAGSVNALAYTSGSNIVFNSGQYNTHSYPGKKLLAHELTHVLQQGGDSLLQNKLIQRDLAIEPTVAAPVVAILTAQQKRQAINYNQILFQDVPEIAEIRDVLGRSRVPSVIDDDFVDAVVDYQASYGLTQDGKLGAATAGRLADEITASANYLTQPATGTPLRRVARRLRLRSMVAARSGSIRHQGFTGSDVDPDGVVTVRTGGNETGLGSPGLTSAITLDYTGRNADNVRWLQFVSIHMSAVPPGAAAPVFQTGTINACGGGAIIHNWSTPAAPTWEIDSCSAADPNYDASFINQRTPGRSMLIADQPGGFLPMAQGFAATFPTAPATVNATFSFDSYAISNGTTPVYHVRWAARYTYNIVAGTESAVSYTIPGGGTTSRLSAPHRAAIDARNPGNGIL